MYVNKFIKKLQYKIDILITYNKKNKMILKQMKNKFTYIWIQLNFNKKT